MSEERFDRLEGQIGQVLQAMTGMESRINNRMDGLDNRMTGLENHMDGLDNRMTGLENRMNDRMIGLENGMNDRMIGLENGMNDRMIGLENSMNDRMSILETTLLTTMRGGFNSLRATVNDIDVDLARVEQRAEDNARKFRRLNQRIMHLEGRTAENPEGE
jgi:predicted  nucleic acid-binding Zn-ribbon protein